MVVVGESPLWQVPPDRMNQTIYHLPGLVRPIPAGPPQDVSGAALTRSDGTPATSGEVLATGFTDAVVILQNGHLVHEWYSVKGASERLHAAMSLTKSVVGAVAGILINQGVLDEQTPLTALLPELRGTGYDGAIVRDLLDMRSGAAFREDYSDPSAEVNQLDDWTGAGGAGLYPFLATLRADRAHGGPFRYRSSETDALGWACERAAGVPMTQLMSELVWSPMGAEYDALVICDPGGTAVHDGGLYATGRDLARFGQLLCDGGTVPDDASGVRVVVPPSWLRNAFAVDVDGRRAFAASTAEVVFPGGWYRNQMWFRPSPYGDVLLCLGIYGQMIHVNRATGTVCVKLSNWPTAQMPHLLLDTVRAFDAIASHLAGPRAGLRTGMSGLMSRDMERGTVSRHSDQTDPRNRQRSDRGQPRT